MRWLFYRRQPATQSFDLEIPIKNGEGCDSIEQATFGKTLSGSVTIDHGLQRIDTLPDDLPDEWDITLLVNGKEVYRTTVKNGGTINHGGIETKFWGKTKFGINLKYSLPWDLDAKIKMSISY